MSKCTVLLGLLLVGLVGSVLPAQSNLHPSPSWDTSVWLSFRDPPGTQYAPEIDRVHSAFFPVKAGSNGPFLGSLQFIHRTVSGVIGVWQWDLSAGTRTLIGGVNTGLDRLLYVGISGPGLLFPGYRHVLIWSGFDSSGIQRIGALPFSGSTLDVSAIVQVPVEAPNGGVWVCASIFLNGIAVLDGVNSTLCWVENGVSLHPGISIEVPRGVRRPFSTIALNSEGEIELYREFSMGLGLVKFVVDVPANRVIEVDLHAIPPVQPPLIVDPVAGLSSGKVLHGTFGGGSFVQIECAPAASGPWTALSPAVAVPRFVAAPLVPFTRALVQGEWVRVRNLSTQTTGDVRQVEAAALVLFVRSLLEPETVVRGATLTIQGGNLLSADGSAPVVSTVAGPWTVTASASNSITVQVPLQSRTGRDTLRIANSFGSKTMAIKVQ